MNNSRVELAGFVFSVLLLSFNNNCELFGNDIVTRIEAQPRSARIPAYQTLLTRQRKKGPERIALIQGFAQHAKVVSPLYQKSRTRWNPAPWLSILREGWEADQTNLNVGLAYCGLLIDLKRATQAKDVAEQLLRRNKSHHSPNAWVRHLTMSAPARILDFELHFCMLTRNPLAHRALAEGQCKTLCDELNSKFRTLDQKAVANFRFKGFTPHSRISGSDSAFIEVGDSTAKYDSDGIAKLFNSCSDDLIRDRTCINVYIFDAHSKSKGFRDVTSHGKRNSNRPYVLLDWERLGAKSQNAITHEMGHAFGLDHVGVPNASISTSTNIMASAAEGFGSGGRRDLGFTPSQTAIVRYHAVRTYSRLTGRKP